MASEVTVRQLPPEEWERLREIYRENGEELPSADGNSAIVAEVDGRIVGMSGLNCLIHTGPLWVAPDYRGKGVSDAMIQKTEEIIRSFGGGTYYMLPSNEHSELLARRLGLAEMPWKVFRKSV